MMYPFNASQFTQAGDKMLIPHQAFDYASYIKTNWPQYKYESMFGFKFLLTDVRPGKDPGDKANYIDANSKFFFGGKNCMMREGEMDCLNDYFLISLPVPRSFLQNQIMNISATMKLLQDFAYLVRTPELEINVSGRINPFELMNLMGSINLGQYKEKNVGSGMMLGQVIPLSQNPDYACIRSRFSIAEKSVFDDIEIIAQIISSVFH